MLLFWSQVLLRVKENEVQYLHKEISCLRNELQFLTSVRPGSSRCGFGSDLLRESTLCDPLLTLCVTPPPQEKGVACQRSEELQGELSSLKSRSERELQGVREHLRLAMAALHEGQILGNSLEH